MRRTGKKRGWDETVRESDTSTPTSRKKKNHVKADIRDHRERPKPSMSEPQTSPKGKEATQRFSLMIRELFGGVHKIPAAIVRDL